MRITVILNDDEYAEVRRRANLVPLSAWFRNLALGDRSVLERGELSEGNHGKAVRRSKPVRLAERSVAAPGRPEHSGCRHGKLAGELCVDCGGIIQER